MGWKSLKNGGYKEIDENGVEDGNNYYDEFKEVQKGQTEEETKRIE
jgi:hypothetical protein